MLARVIGHRFRRHVDIVNGETKRGGGGRDVRKQMPARFREAPGSGAIVLSPFVAGVGLTITEANHVIHYGRWWNPAIEGQATDRAYRIGQTKPVTVYYPVLTDPTGRLPSLPRGASPRRPSRRPARRVCGSSMGPGLAAAVARHPVSRADVAALAADRPNTPETALARLASRAPA